MTGFPTEDQSTAIPSGPAGGDLAGTYPNPSLGAIGVATGPIGSTTITPVITIDAKGRVTVLSSVAVLPAVLSGQNGVYAPPMAAPLAPSVAVGAASRGYYSRFVPATNLLAARISFVTTIAAGSNDNCDVGIFNSTGATLLASSGSTAGVLNAAAGVKTVAFGVPVQLVAGTVYYAAFAYGTVGTTAASLAATGGSALANDVLTLFGSGLGTVEQVFQAGGFPLAAPFASSGTIMNTPILAVRP